MFHPKEPTSADEWHEVKRRKPTPKENKVLVLLTLHIENVLFPPYIHNYINAKFLHFIRYTFAVVTIGLN